MKNEIRLALLCLAVTAAPAFAQSSPMCGSTNLDRASNAFTVVNPSASTVNQQCYVTVHRAGAIPAGADPASNLAEGTYTIELSGGGGGGGGGARRDGGGGGGGAGAAPSKTTQYLAPGNYKLTIGTGGLGGSANGGRTMDGNPSSVTNANTGQLIAGFAGADTWTPRFNTAADGRGGVGKPGGSTGGSGGDSGPRSEEPAQAGGALQTPGYSGTPGQPGGESGRSAKTDQGRSAVQANAGGGGGAGVGSGGSGDTARRTMGADPGDRGGHGFIKLALLSATPVAMAPVAPAPAYVAPAPAYVAPAPIVAAKKDRN